MIKTVKFLWSAVFIFMLFLLGMLLADKATLHNDFVRLHVVANSDSSVDQSEKIAVRDAVLDYLQPELDKVNDAVAAKSYLSKILPSIADVANRTLRQIGSTNYATVRLQKEAFTMRSYDTFRLPSGVYDSLRINIGNATGENWWCVVYPSLCLPKTQAEFVDVAVDSGFDRGFASMLSEDESYQVRFYLLDLLGKIEKFFTKD